MLDPSAVEVTAMRDGRLVDLTYLDQSNAKGRLRNRSRGYIIGHTKQSRWHLGTNDLPPWLEEMPIVRAVAGGPGGYEVLWLPSFRGHAEVREQICELANLPGALPCTDIEGAFAWPLPRGGRVVLWASHYQFVVTETRLPERHKSVLLTDLDLRKQAYTLGAAVAHALFLLLILTIPPDPKSLSLDAFGEINRMIQFQLKPQEESPRAGANAPHAGTPGFVHAANTGYQGKSGKMGDPNQPKHKGGRATLAGPPQNRDIYVAQELATEAARNAGVLGTLARREGSQIASIFGREHALGNDADSLLGNLSTDAPGAGFGNNGLGPTGSGRGGGGTGKGFIEHRDGPTRIGNPRDDDFVFGRSPRSNPIGHTAKAPETKLGHAEVRGALDKEIVRRVVRKHIAEVRFCYENAALKNPSLSGRVVVSFTIGGTGLVSSSKVAESSTGNATLDGCIAAAARRWQFPQPQGGGLVVVSYPFVLELAGR